MQKTIKYLWSPTFALVASMLLIAANSTSAGTSARDHKQSARDNLTTNIGVENQEQAAALKKAVAHLDESLNPGLWHDPDHLVKGGEKVFDEEKEAAHSLLEFAHDRANDRRLSSVRSISLLDVIATLELLVRADSTLALTALNEVILRCENDKCEDHIDNARHFLDELQKLSDRDEEKHTKEIELYKKVWQQAKEGMEIILTSYGESPEVLPSRWTIHQNYPNPVNPSTIISYSLLERSFVSIKVYNLLGQEVALLVDQEKQAGSYSVEWNGERFPSGVYFYRFRAGSYSDTKRLLLLK